MNAVAHPISQQPSVWSRLRARMAELWFAPGDARALALCRIMIFWFIWPGFTPRQYGTFTEIQTLVWQPVGLFRAFDLRLLSEPVLNAMGVVHAVSAGCAMVGLWYRPAALTTAVLGVYLYSISQNFGKINHNNNLLTLTPFIFAFARAADVWSVDQWLAKRRGSVTATLPSGEYRWPIQFVALLIATMYTAAGLSKLWRTGMDWAEGERFARLLLRHHFTHSPPTDLGVVLASHPLLCKVFAAGALVLELAAPLSLVARLPRAIILTSLGLLQLSIWLLMGVGFVQMIPLFLCVLPWQWLLRQLDRLRGKP
jgi:Vitamin K-dependent gamma-carboxylase